MKNLILLLVFLLGSYISFGQSEKTLIRSFNVNVNEVVFPLECKKSVLTWDKTYVRVELMVKTNLRYEILDVLAKNGRYNFESQINNQTLIITLPNLKDKIKIGELELVENFEIKIWLPNETIVKDGILNL
jgi:hypothetical protein